MKSVLIRVNQWLKNEKSGFSNEKIAKSHTTFRNNKANVKIGNINISSFITDKYAKMTKNQSSIINNHLKSKPNQTQFKANTNPICYIAIIGLSSLMTSKYVKFEDLAGKKQTQTKPTPSEAQVLSIVEGSSSLSSNVVVGEQKKEV